MKVKMKLSIPGSEDGVTVKMYHAGEVYEMGEALATVFLSEGYAEEITDSVEEKALGASPENKMMGSPANKEEKEDVKKRNR